MTDHKLHLLDSFEMLGSDGKRYKVRAYEHLVHDDSIPADGREHWEPTGQAEYRLDDGRPLRWVAEHEAQVSGDGLRLQRPSA